MAEFICKVGTATGDIQELTFRAENETVLRRELTDKGYHVFKARRSFGLSALFSQGSIGRERIKAGDFMLFNQELAALLRSGLPLLQGLDIMLERMKHPLFRRVLADIRDKVKSGTALSDAFRSHGDLFPRIYAASLLAGEKSGNLEQVIRRYLNYQKLTLGTQKKVVAALVYPCFLFAFMIIAAGYLLLVVIPKFSELFETIGGAGKQLPPLTVALLGVANAARDHYVLILTVVVGSAVLLYSLVKKSPASVDRVTLEVPIVGKVLRLFATSQLNRSLSTLLAGGIPLVQSIEISARSIGNRYLGDKVAPVADRVREGKSFASCLEATGEMDNLTIEMAKVGEATGGLAEMLSNVADFCDEEIENRLNVLLALLTPVVLAIMGALVAVMLLAIYMPLFEAASIK